MQVNDDFILAIFAIAITLSAYLSAIRMVAIQKIDDLSGDDPKETDPAVKAAAKAKARKQKWKLTKKLGWLTLADAPMVTSAFLLGLYLLWNILGFKTICYQLFRADPHAWLLTIGLWLFLIAGTVMLLMHVVAWVKTFCGLRAGEEKLNQTERVLITPTITTEEEASASDANATEGDS